MRNETSFLPTRPAQRIRQIDILRGFALMGILLVNVFGYHASFYNFSEFYQGLQGPTQIALYQWMITLGSDKFIFLFSMLFGYSFWMLSAKFNEAHKFTTFYTRRMLALSLIGIFHIVFFWAGDVLFMYGILGLLLLMSKNLNTKTLWALALFSYFFPILFLLLRAYLPFLPDPISSTSSIKMNEVIRIFSTGNYINILFFRLNEFITFRNINLLYYAPKVFALFIAGYLAGKGRWLGIINRHLAKFQIVGFASLLVGFIILMKLDVFLFLISSSESRFFLAIYIAIYETGNAFVGFAYLLIILTFSKSKIGHKLLSPFQYVGRMALTNYLLQSLIFTTLFYGYGFGLFGKSNPSDFLLWAIVVFTLQVILSKIWLSKFRFGPMEYLWRRMTYGKQMKRK